MSSSNQDNLNNLLKTMSWIGRFSPRRRSFIVSHFKKYISQHPKDASLKGFEAYLRQNSKYFPWLMPGQKKAVNKHIQNKPSIDLSTTNPRASGGSRSSIQQQPALAQRASGKALIATGQIASITNNGGGGGSGKSRTSGGSRFTTQQKPALAQRASGKALTVAGGNIYDLSTTSSTSDGGGSGQRATQQNFPPPVPKELQGFLSLDQRRRNPGHFDERYIVDRANLPASPLTIGNRSFKVRYTVPKIGFQSSDGSGNILAYNCGQTWYLDLDGYCRLLGISKRFPKTEDPFVWIRKDRCNDSLDDYNKRQMVNLASNKIYNLPSGYKLAGFCGSSPKDLENYNDLVNWWKTVEQCKKQFRFIHPTLAVHVPAELGEAIFDSETLLPVLTVSQEQHKILMKRQTGQQRRGSSSSGV